MPKKKIIPVSEHNRYDPRLGKKVHVSQYNRTLQNKIIDYNRENRGKRVSRKSSVLEGIKLSNKKKRELFEKFKKGEFDIEKKLSLIHI